MPIMPGVWSPPPAMPASVEKVMPTGVMLRSSRETTIMPLASGTTMAMHSKQPHAVIGSCIIEYMVTRSTVWLEV